MIDTIDKLKALTLQGETTEVEFKSARGGLPASMWETYSAFANTNGGVIVLGVQEKNGIFSLDGLTEETVSRYIKNFWDCVHNRGKVSVCLPKDSDVYIEQIDKAYVLICHIPRANFDLRPVYLTTNPFGNTYRRNHEGDYKCTDTEVRRMFADADHERHPEDGKILTGYKLERDIDMTSLRQYRQTMANLQPTHPWIGISDMEFLQKIGAYTTDYETGQEGFTKAGILMFGKYDSITNLAGIPSFFVDYRERVGTNDPNIRWTDRLYPDGLWEANLYQFYVRTYNKLIQALPRPFKLTEGIRQEETTAHDAVREALINCIIHQDLNAIGNIIVEQTDTVLTFKNPGIMLVSKQQYYKGGTSICRNPILQKMFMRLGRAEKAGSGVDKIVSGWEEIGWPVPMVTEEFHPDYVILTMPIGKNAVINEDIPHKYPASTPQVPHKYPTSNTQVPHKFPTNTPQVPHKYPTGTLRVLTLIKVIDNKELSIRELMELVNLKDRKNFMNNYLNPAIQSGFVEPIYPNQANHPKQKYRLTKTDINNNE